MIILAGGITHGQAVALLLLCIFLVIFIVADIYLVLFLRRKNKKLVKKRNLVSESEKTDDGTSGIENESETTEKK